MSKRYRIASLKQALLKLTDAYSVPRCQGEILINSMLEADMCGVHTHGLSLVPTYIKKIENAGFNLSDKVSVIKSTATFTVVDANNLIGAVSAAECTDIAIRNAQKNGMHTVFCKNANTFGPAFYYTKKAVENGLVGFCACNSPANMSPWGGTQKLLGTNPFSVGVPAKRYAPIMVDMATSVVAKSKINEIRKNGGTLPDGWALDKNGNPTNDPVAAIGGTVLPMAQHKGSAIAICIDIICGMLSGAAYLNDVGRFYSDDNRCMNVGQCFTVIDPVAISDTTFYDKVDEYIDRLHSSGTNVLYPGEKESINRALAENGGVELFDETVTELNALFAKNNLTGGIAEYAR